MDRVPTRAARPRISRSRNSLILARPSRGTAASAAEFPVVDGVTVLWDDCVVLACPDCGSRIPRRSEDGWETVLVLPEPDVVVVDGLDPQPDSVPCAVCLNRVPLFDAKPADVSLGRGSVLCPPCDAALDDVVSTALEIGG